MSYYYNQRPMCMGTLDILLNPEVCVYSQNAVHCCQPWPLILCCVGSPAAFNLSAVSTFILSSILWEEDGLNQSTYVLSKGTPLGVCKPLIVSPQAYLLFTFALWFRDQPYSKQKPTSDRKHPIRNLELLWAVQHHLLFITNFYFNSTNWNFFFSNRMSLVI